MVSAPNRLSILGLGKRAPSEESNTLKSLPKACSALPTTNGARVMLSTPPATHTSASPQVMACAAPTSALRPEPHSRLCTAPGVSTGRPASSSAWRATLRLSSPAWRGAADRHVVDDLRREARARHHLLDDAGQQIVGPHARQRARVPAERRAQSIVDVGFEHGPRLPRAAYRLRELRRGRALLRRAARLPACTPWGRARRAPARP